MSEGNNNDEIRTVKAGAFEPVQIEISDLEEIHHEFLNAILQARTRERLMQEVIEGTIRAEIGRPS